MDSFGFALYSFLALFAFTLFWFLEVLVMWLSWILEHWEVITLIVTNVGALFLKPPFRKS